VRAAAAGPAGGAPGGARAQPDVPTGLPAGRESAELPAPSRTGRVAEAWQAAPGVARLGWAPAGGGTFKSEFFFRN
jgi:hypothetical protein